MSCIALKPAALSPQRFSPFSGSTSPLSPPSKLKAPTPAGMAAMTPAAPARTTTTAPPSTITNAAAEKKDFASLTSRTVAGPNAPSKAQNSARARDAKSMPKATGRWTAEEHDEFLKCLDIYGREWKKVAERITTRTAAQIRSHAQKYFKKIEAAGEGAPKAAKPAAAPLVEGAPQIPAETLAGALGALDDMLRALRSKRARYDDDQTPSETGSDEAAAPPVEKRPRAASEGLVIPQAKRSRANSDDRAPGLRRRVTCDDLRALEALELLREAAGGAF